MSLFNLRPLGLSLFLACAALPATAQTIGADNCEATSAVVAQAIEARSEGTSAEALKARLTQDAEADDAFKTAIPAIVDWVYSLQPSLATPAMAEQFEKQCLNY